MIHFPFLLIGGAVAIYLIGVLPQYWDGPFTYDFFYTLWRAKKAIQDPLSIFQPNFAMEFRLLPFLFVSFIDRFFGFNSIAYGFFVGGFHILNSLLLYKLVRLMKIPDVPAAIASVFFLFLSNHYAVLWDMEQLGRLMCFSLFLSSLILFVQFLLTKQLAYWVCSWAVFIVSLGSGQDSITEPLLLLVLIPLVSPKGISFLKGFVFTLPFFVVSLAFGLLSIYLGMTKGPGLGLGIHAPLNFICLMNEFLHFLFIPRPEFVSSIPFPSVLIRLIPPVLISLFLLAFLNLKKDRIRQIIKEEVQLSGYKFLIFGVLWFIITSSIYCLRPMSYLWQGRYLYIPGMGVSIIGGAIVYKIGTSLQLAGSRLRLSFLSVLFYMLVLNIFTTLFLVHKIRASVNTATKEELPVAFSFISGIRDGYGAPLEIPRNAVLIVEGIPIPIPRLKEFMLSYYTSLPAEIVDAEDESKLKTIPRDGRYDILHLKWQDNHMVVSHASG